MIKRSKVLLEKVAESDEDGDVRLSRTDLHGTDYHCVAADFTNPMELTKKLDECNIDYNCPTIFIAECVLVYVTTSQVSFSNFSIYLIFKKHPVFQ